MKASIWAIFLVLALTFGAVAQQTEAKPAEPKKIDADEFAKLLKEPGKVVFLDVRTKEEIEKLGSVKGYVHIPINELESRLNELPKDKPIVTMCARGVRAGRATTLLENKGYRVLGGCGLESFKESGRDFYEKPSSEKAPEKK